MAKRRKLWKLLPVVRAIGVLSAVGIITTLVTFAAIQSTGNALTGNTIETATATLQISKDGTNFSDNVTGYDFNGLVPGGAAQPVTGYMVALHNTGSTNLALSLAVPAAPVTTGAPDLGKVWVVLTPYNPGGGTYAPQSIRLSDLVAGKVALTAARLNAGAFAYFHLQIGMDTDAITGGGATITGLDLSFSGIPQ
ncbi:MAG: hypothetical protein WDN27_07040 [Candidatus Saccharibacteria bacterium]